MSKLQQIARKVLKRASSMPGVARSTMDVWNESGELVQSGLAGDAERLAHGLERLAKDIRAAAANQNAPTKELFSRGTVLLDDVRDEIRRIFAGVDKLKSDLGA